MEDLFEFGQGVWDFVKGVSQELSASGIIKQTPGLSQKWGPFFAWVRDRVATATAPWRRGWRWALQECRHFYRDILALPTPVKGGLAVFTLNLVVMAVWEIASPGAAPWAVTAIPAIGMVLGVTGWTCIAARSTLRFASKHMKTA